MMSDILRLDPFQMVRSFTVPEVSVPVPDVGVISRADRNAEGVFTRLWQCQERPPDACPDLAWDPADYFYSQFFCQLSANLVDCSQLVFEVIGRTTGVRKTWDMNAVFLGYNFDCKIDFADNCEGRDECYGFVLSDIVEAPIEGGNKNLWRPGTQDHFVQSNIFTLAPLGFQENERIDINLPGFSQSIDLIEQGSTASRLRVWPDGGSQFQRNANIRIDGTENYDALYNVEQSTIGDPWFEILGTYVEDETSGTVSAAY